MYPTVLAARDASEVLTIVSLLGFFFAVVVAISLAVSVVVCLFVHTALARVPVQHRRIEPVLVWLLLIPCFGFLWNFFVFLRVPDSFRSYFNSIGRNDVGDCGRGIGMAFSVTAVLAVLPLVNYLAGPASLVLLILCLVKFHELKNQIPPEATARPTPVSARG